MGIRKAFKLVEFDWFKKSFLYVITLHSNFGRGECRAFFIVRLLDFHSGQLGLGLLPIELGHHAIVG